jgi:hypothetical protein
MHPSFYMQKLGTPSIEGENHMLLKIRIINKITNVLVVPLSE